MSSSREVIRVVSPARTVNATGVSYPPLTLEDIPEIEFPKSIQKLDGVDFWLESSLTVSADGEVRDIRVPTDLAFTPQERSFFDSVLPRLSAKQSRVAQAELFGMFRDRLKRAKFKPRLEDAQDFPMNVFVKSHFRSDGSCQKIETFVQTPRAVIWSQTSISKDPCF